MKKIVFILICVLSVANASAVSYSSPYKGAGRNGYAPMGYRSSVGISHAPTATMRSTSSVAYSTAYAGSTQAMSNMTMQVQGIYTAASAVRGGVTSSDTYAGMFGAPRRTPQHPGDAEPCGDCVDTNGDGVCDICDCDIEACDCDPCRCPLDETWDVWVFLALLAVGYAVWKKRHTDPTESSAMRTTCE